MPNFSTPRLLERNIFNEKNNIKDIHRVAKLHIVSFMSLFFRYFAVNVPTILILLRLYIP